MAALWYHYISRGALAQEIRRSVVAQLHASLGREVRLDGVRIDWPRGVTLRGLRIADHGGFGRGGGTAFSADDIVLSFDWWRLLSIPPDIAGSLRQATLVRPRLVLARDARGVWSVADLLGIRGPSGPSRFRGRLGVVDGSGAFTDAFNLPAPFQASYARIAGEADFRRADEVVFSARGSAEAATGGESVRVAGRYHPKDGTSELDVTATNASASRWGRYLVRVRELEWERGRFGGRVHLSLAASPTGVGLEFQAALTLHDADVVDRPRGFALRHASGPITVDSRHAETPGLTMRANGSALVLDGSMVFDGGPWIQIGVVSPDLDLAAVQALFFPKAALTLTGTSGAHVQVVGPVQALNLDGEITGAAGRFNGQPFSGLDSGLRYAAGTLALTGLRASAGGGTIAGDVVLDLQRGAPTYLFNGTARGVDVTALASAGLSGLGQVRGRVSGRVMGVGTGTRAQFLGDVTFGRGSLRGIPFDEAHAIFWRAGDGRIEVDYLSGQRGSATVYSAGQIGADGSMNLDVVGRDLSLAGIAAEAGLTGPGALALDGRGDLVGRVTGTTASPQVSGRVTASHGRVGPIAFAHAEGTLTISPRGLSTPGLDLINGTAEYRARGALSFRPARADGLRVDVDNADAQWLTGALPLAPALSGAVNGAVTIDGPLSAPSISGALTLDRGAVRGQRLDHVDVRLVPDPGRIHVAGAEARVNGSRLSAAGTIDLGGALALSLTGTNIRLADVDAALGLQLPVPVEGAFSLSGAVRGTIRDPIVSGQVSAPRVTVGGENFEASGGLEYEGRVVRLSGLQMTQGASRYRLSGEIRAGPPPSAGLVLDVERGQVGSVLSAVGLRPAAPLAGTVDGRIELAGPLDDPSARLSLTLRDATFGAYQIGQGVADLTLTHQAIDIDRFEIHPAQGTVAAKGRIDLRGNNSVEVSAQDLNPDFLRPFLQLDRPLEGRLNFVLQFSGPTRDPKAGISLEALDAGIAGVQADRIAALAFYSAGALTLEQGVISKGPHKVVALGTIPIDPAAFAVDPRAPLQLQFRLQDADLTFLSLVAPAITGAAGTVQGEVTVGGTIESPRMAGFLKSAGGRFRDTALNMAVDDLTVDLAFTQDQVEVHDVSAAIGRGRAAMDGTVSVTNLRPNRLQLAVKADRVTLDIPELYSGTVNASLQLTGPALRPTLSGRATLEDGMISPAGTIGRGGVAGNVGLGVLPPDLRLDMTLEAGRNTIFTMGAIRAEVEGPVHVGGTLAHPLLSGRVTSPEGEVAFLGSTFRLNGGEAVFSESLGVEPQISARAQQVYGDTIVFLDVSGPATHPELTLTSNPPLPQQDIVTLVARNAGILGGPEAVLGQGLGQYLLGPVREALHLNEFSVSYSRESPLTLRAGKLLLQNLYLTLSEVWPAPQGATALPLGTFPRAVQTTTQSYAQAGIEYFFSPNVLATVNVDTLGGAGLFVLTRFPF